MPRSSALPPRFFVDYLTLLKTKDGWRVVAKDNAGKQKLAQEICTELTVHATIEEEIFYPACKEAVEDDLEHEAYVEHDGAKVLIAEIAQGNPEDEFYDAKVMVLSEMIKHHVKE